jgi:hypothetical protein
MNDVLLCTIGDDRLLPGLEVLLYSMRRNVPEFCQYPLKLYCHASLAPLSSAGRQRLRQAAPQAAFEAVEAAAYRSLEANDGGPHEWLALELFRETGYRQVLFFGPGMLCLRDFTDLFALPDEYDFAACEAGGSPDSRRAEGPAEGRWGRRKWFGLWGPRPTAIDAGLLLVGRRFRTPQVYAELLELACRAGAPSTAQGVIDRYFGARKTLHYLLPQEYNWQALNRFGKAARQRVRLLHWTGSDGRPRPWEAGAPADLAGRVWGHYADELRRRRAAA